MIEDLSTYLPQERASNVGNVNDALIDAIDRKKNPIVSTQDVFEKNVLRDNKSFYDRFDNHKGDKKKNIGFDEVADEVDLKDVSSIQFAFDLYRKENTPPCEIDDILDEEKFEIKKSEEGEKNSIILEFVIPSIEKEEEADQIREYFEVFMEMIGIEDIENDLICELIDDRRGGANCEIAISIKY